MGITGRLSNMDVSNCVDVTDPDAIAAAVLAILGSRYPGADFSRVNTLISDMTRLYCGEFPGFQACDIGYHNLQHVLDVTLAMARLLDGHDGTELDGVRLGPQLALAGITAALFHDSGYIRRTRDSRNKSGAAYTRVHVSRSARFMADYLPTVGMDEFVGVCTRIVHFTGYEIDPFDIEVATPQERRLGELLGTADLIAQMADLDYVSKCREYLFEEFRAGGLIGEHASQYPGAKIFRSRDHLLESTPGFIRNAIETRLEGQFGVFSVMPRHISRDAIYIWTPFGKIVALWKHNLLPKKPAPRFE